jgi:sugar/nucleoside kinase (ribokinase family)
MKPDIYAFGMTCLSTIHVLDGDYPAPDTYREITKTYTIPSGEAGNAALLLAHFGLRVKLDGPRLGVNTGKIIPAFYAGKGIDCSGMTYDADYPGVEDLVLVDAHTRTIFGRFAHYHGSGENRWSAPDREAISAARAVSLDPGFRAESKLAAEFCAASGTPYVTIDLRPEDEIHRRAAISVISNEFIQREYPGADVRRLFAEYAERTAGLVIFTFGSKDILFGRQAGPINSFTPFRVESRGSLAAGDYFRGGAVYALFCRWPDEKIISFSAAVGALVCARFPAALNPPDLDEIINLAATKK